mmetsp:Transcript_2979/g.7611  ORF Transcript_2979/g.7611 Transcript_2979/m.7611 type:complete len:839 (+) Transcript_2979:116-2632(+)
MANCHRQALSCFLLCLIHHAIAISPAGTRRRRSPVNALQREGRPQPFGAIYAEHNGYPKGSNHSVEMLRFITAYGTGLEVVVDVTPYVPLLRTAAAAYGELSFYSYIETWVGNDTGSSVLFVNTSANNCSAAKHFDGNGWELNAELVAWPRQLQQPDTKPFAAVTLATGRYGSAYRIGAVDWLKGNLTSDGTAVVLDDSAALDLAAGASVYPCSGSAEGDLRKASVFGYLAQQARFLQGDEREESLQMLGQTLVEMYAWQHFVQAKVESLGPENETARVSYNASLADIQVGSPVFFSSAEVLTAFKVTGGYALIPVPLEPMGNVTAVYPGMLDVRLNYPCFGHIEGLPSLLLLKRSDALDELRTIVNETILFGEQLRSVQGVSLSTEVEQYLSGPWFIRQQNGTFDWVPAMARLQVGPTASSVLELETSQLVNGTLDGTVCIVSHVSSGHLFSRDFALPALAEGDRAVMQLTVTGHGWAATSEQCGEYCHAVYRFSINGVPAVNVTQWRDDCKDNPIGPRQHGTWDESRNGWCPGSAEPGLFIDVTQWVTTGENTLRMDVVVWSNSTWSYTPYTNYAGFALNDRASLTVGLTMFAYDSEAVQAVLQQPAALSAAEAALRSGSSMPSALHIPEIPQRGVPPASFAEMRKSAFDRTQSSFLQRVASSNLLPALEGISGLDRSKSERGLGLAGTAQDRERQLSAVSHHMSVQGPTRFDFEARAPWYFYNSSSEGRPGEQTLNVSRINLFNGELVQGRSQLIRVSFPLESLQQHLDWEQTAQVALHLRLADPAGNLSIDHWDRQGSIGILLDAKPVEAKSGLSLYREPLQSRTKAWSLLRSS